MRDTADQEIEFNKISSKFKTYEQAHTEWTIFFLKFIETVLTLTCLSIHIDYITNEDQPMPHHVIFCATFGGFFILSVAGMLVPLSGQVTPPGVDLMFCSLAFVLLFISACVAMRYIAVDEYLKDDEVTDDLECAYPFFRNCYYHSVLSLITATFYLMHAAMSADRLLGMQKGYFEDEEAYRYDIFNMPLVDIPEHAPLSLYLFFFDYLVYVHNSSFGVKVRKCFGCGWFRVAAKKRGHRKKSLKKRRPSPHQKALLKSMMVLVSEHAQGDEDDEELRRIMSSEFYNIAEPRSLESFRRASSLWNKTGDSTDIPRKPSAGKKTGEPKSTMGVRFETPTEDSEREPTSTSAFQENSPTEFEINEPRITSVIEEDHSQEDEKVKPTSTKSIIRKEPSSEMVKDSPQEINKKRKKPVVWFASEVQEKTINIADDDNDSDEEELPDIDKKHDEPIYWFSTDKNSQKRQKKKRDKDTVVQISSSEDENKEQDAPQNDESDSNESDKKGSKAHKRK